MGREEYSLRWKLLGLISLPIILAGMVIGGFAIFSTFHEIEEVSDAQLINSARVLLKLTEHELEESDTRKIEIGIEDSNISSGYESKIAFRIWKGDHLALESFKGKSFGKNIVVHGLSDKIIGDDRWRFFVYTDKTSNITIEIAERYDIRIEFISHIIGSLLIPGVIFLPIILFLVWYGTTNSLRPLVLLSELVDKRDANDLTTIDLKGKLPQEISPLMVAFNRLLVRVDESIRHEREFTDNAAHELRTPLAAMKTQTQVLIKKIKGDPEYKEGLDNLERSIDRATHMITQLLAFARVQNNVKASFNKVNFSILVQEVLQGEAHIAVEKDIDLTASINTDIFIIGNNAALSIMVRNIVENAIKFTPKLGNISISLQEQGDKVSFIVSDSGLGVPDDKKEKVFKRFYRKDSGKTEGSGLGLSMVAWICETHNAKIELSDNISSGLIASVYFKKIDT